MNIVLLSGGSGKRLWPLSNDTRSKQFLKLFKNESGVHESMVQRVYRQITTVSPDSTVVISTGKNQVSAIQNHLGSQVGICIEPSRRDTFPAIALAAAYMHSEKGLRDSDVVIVCPIDPYVELNYFKALQRLEAAAMTHGSNLTLLGVKPTYPSEKYGYIIPEQENDLVRKVLSFHEKPDLPTARQYMERGALWNCGVFAFRLDYLLSIVQEYIQCDTYQEVFTHYDQLPKISFDYAVAEKEKNINCIEFSGDWKDVGTWATLAEEMDASIIGNACMDEVCQDVHVINELETPLLVMGAQNMIIAVSADGILVSSKERSSHIKKYVDQMEQAVMFEEKSWGTFKVLSMDDCHLMAKLNLLPGRSMSCHRHAAQSEVWTVISGEGTATLNGVEQIVCSGDVIRLPPGVIHGLKAAVEMQVIEIQFHDSQDDPEGGSSVAQ